MSDVPGWVEVPECTFYRLINALHDEGVLKTLTMYSDPKGEHPLSRGRPTSIHEYGIKGGTFPFLRRCITSLEDGAYVVEYLVRG